VTSLESSFDHFDAQDTAALIPAPSARAFIRTGKLTPGFRAAVVLYGDGDSAFDGLAEYVQARVHAGQTDTPKDWPR
jgi:hypothetical protein